VVDQSAIHAFSVWSDPQMVIEDMATKDHLALHSPIYLLLNFSANVYPALLLSPVASHSRLPPMHYDRVSPCSLTCSCFVFKSPKYLSIKQEVPFHDGTLL
jgi:hypothetical protein